MSRNVSLAFTTTELENYTTRLHFNTALDVVVNFVAILLVFKHSIPAMKYYKYYILLTIICTLIMDLHLTVIYGIYPMFPTTIICAAGLVKDFGWFWGQTFNWCVFHVTLSLSGGSVFVGVTYQYFSLSGKDSFFHSLQGLMLCTFGITVYALPSLGMYIPCINYELTRADVNVTTPHLFEFFITHSCNSSVLNIQFLAYLCTIFLQMNLLYVVGIVVVWRIFKRLTAMENFMSANTLKLRKLYLYVLIVQALIPLIFIVFPISFLLITIFFNFMDISAASLWLVQLFSLHSCGNALTIIFMIRPYREKLFEWVKVPLVPFKKYLPATLFNNSSKVAPISVAISGSTPNIS